MTVDITFIGLDALVAKLAALADSSDGALLTKSQVLANALADKVRANLSGDVLQSKTGTLLDSIQSAVEETGQGTSASVFVAGDVPYAAIQESGGTTRAHIIEATAGKALAFNWAGKQAFFAHINHPGSTIPAHNYMSGALEEGQGDIVEELVKTVMELLQ